MSLSRKEMFDEMNRKRIALGIEPISENMVFFYREYEFRNGYSMRIEGVKYVILRLKSFGPKSLIERIRSLFNPNIKYWSLEVFPHSELPEDLLLSKYALNKWSIFYDIPFDLERALILCISSLLPTELYKEWEGLK